MFKTDCLHCYLQVIRSDLFVQTSLTYLLMGCCGHHAGVSNYVQYAGGAAFRCKSMRNGDPSSRLPNNRAVKSQSRQSTVHRLFSVSSSILLCQEQHGFCSADRMHFHHSGFDDVVVLLVYWQWAYVFCVYASGMCYFLSLLLGFKLGMPLTNYFHYRLIS